MEDIRLIVWDLDETFWRGTLTEGSMEYVSRHHELVIALAQRGIMSSICSRNDHETVKSVLTDAGLWNYFIFPSIDWTAKGARLKALVDSVQLRPSTVLFIDDNPMNRAEAQHFVAGIAVADPSIVHDLLGNPLLRGKDDHELTRLAQYKLLERRGRDQVHAVSRRDFLLASDIWVWIDQDIESNIDRAIELINRTNQLNFTKRRLPEDLKEARRELRALIGRYDMQAGLIRVTDRYGDYGYCGLYVHSKAIHAAPELLHFCFSCRILGMHVENWLYRRLGSPAIAVQGDVLADLDSKENVDWIAIGVGTSERVPQARKAAPMVSRIFMRGGCELVPVSHYFELLTGTLAEEFAFSRDAVPVRRDHSQMLRLALNAPSEAEMTALGLLNFKPEDFQTVMPRDEAADCAVCIFSFWADVTFPVFRHRTLGFRVPLHAHPLTGGDLDLTQFDLAALKPELASHWIAAAIAEIKENYVFEGLIDVPLFHRTVTEILGALPRNCRTFVLGAGEKVLEQDGTLRDVPRHIAFNQWLRDVLRQFPRITYLGIDDYIRSDAERQNGEPNHFAREVYFRLFEAVRGHIAGRAGDATVPVAVS